jgi:hypothetical protein
MRTFPRDNGLAVFFGLLFLLALGGQAVAGFHAAPRSPSRWEPRTPRRASKVDEKIR